MLMFYTNTASFSKQEILYLKLPKDFTPKLVFPRFPQIAVSTIVKEKDMQRWNSGSTSILHEVSKVVKSLRMN